ncbi:hypothetical protein M1329_01180, partial [Candidatus Marsarchaeota archaeon]|nr:hypothetical protein [Candidatus Marsarchaeota archaeon]
IAAPSKTSARWTTQSGRFTFNPNSKNPSSVYIPLAATALAIGAAAKRHSQVKKEKASILKGEDELLQKGGGGADYFQAKKQKTREAKSAFYEQKKKERGEEKAQNREKKAQDAQASKQKIREQKADFKKMWGSMNSEERKNYAKDARKAYFWGGDQKYINYKTGKPVEGVFEKGVIASGVAQWVRASRQKREPTNLAAPSSGNKNVSDSERKEKVDQQKQQAEEQSRKEEEKAQKEKEEKAQKEKEEQERKEKEDKG